MDHCWRNCCGWGGGGGGGGGGGTLGLLTWFGQRNRRIGCPQLGFDTCDIGIEQTALVGTLLLAAFGELASLEDGDREQVAR